MTTLSSGCSLLGGDDGPSARDEADAVARALSAGRPGTLDVLGSSGRQAQTAWDTATRGLGSVHPSVSVVSVTEPEDSRAASARLAYRWPLPGLRRPWTYRTTVRLLQTGSGSDARWRVRLAPSLVHPDLRTGERLSLAHTLADRADILGAGGTPLVTARPVDRFGIDKTLLPRHRQARAARRLAGELGVDPRPYAARVAAAGPKAFVEAIVLRRSAARTVLAHGVGDLPGVRVVADTLPLAPTRDFARALLGTVGEVDADAVKRSGGLYQAGDVAGLSGLEARYDDQLRGTPGSTVSAVNDQGRSRTLFSVDPVAGTPLRTTLDRGLQSEAERDLAGVRPASALVAIRPSTGRLLAVANGPGAAGYATATLGRYAPGSTFKVVSSLALLRAGLTPSSTVDCPSSTVVDGKGFSNYSDYPTDGLGRITLATAVANSCNTAFIGQRDRVSQEDLASAAASLGLGVDHDTGFPSYFGSVPTSQADAGGATGHAASMIGQGRVLASPMAMAAVAASVASGSRVVPVLVPDQVQASAAPAHPLTPREATRLRSLMRGVVTRGSGSFLAGLPGDPVLAKTGTAEFGNASPPRTHAWMIAVHGDLAVAVFVDVGESGSGTAGPILERFLRAAG